jgi:serine/threonine protein phosphatase 1
VTFRGIDNSMTTRFSPGIESQHLHLDVDEWDDVYVVGDVHGCRREFECLLDRLGATADDLVVVVGDLVRKGPDSRGVVELVRASPNVFSVRGNNEEKLLRGEKTLPELDEADIAYLASLPAVISLRDSLVVHGGVDPRKPLAHHDVDDLQTTRSIAPDGGSYERPLWFDGYDGPDRVFFGHTPLSAPVRREFAIGLDTGCVYGGTLTAFDWRRDEVTSVPGREIQSRPDSKFVDPRGPPPTPGR